MWNYVYGIIQVAIHTHPSNPYTGARAMCARFIVHLTLYIFDFLHIKPCSYVCAIYCTSNPTHFWFFAHLTLRARSFLAHLTPKFFDFLWWAWRKTPLSLSVGRLPLPLQNNVYCIIICNMMHIYIVHCMALPFVFEGRLLCWILMVLFFLHPLLSL